MAAAGAALLCLALLVAGSITALAANNTVPPSRAGETSRLADVNDVKPPECSSITLTTRISGAGVIVGTPGNDLIVGSGGADTITGLGGSDCIQGLSGDDSIDGGADNDVCLGGPGSDTFQACESQTQ
ncbi:MAG TPA: hypothetical protein VFK89_01415 [Actinomycetota bacterium]|nr:hypothetical protein [Actinomycetota bacterium]